MSDAPEVTEYEERAPVEPVATSLQARMKERREEVEANRSELFPVPRFQEIIAAELGIAPQGALDQIGARYARQSSGGTLSTPQQADEMIAGTIGFAARNDDGGWEPVEGLRSWKQLAIEVAGFDLPPEAGERPALILVVGAANVSILWGQWRMWLSGQRVGVSAEVERDFQTTP